jgi:hypothetical protein
MIMKINRSALLWLCFIASTLLALTGFSVFFHEHKTLADFLLAGSLLFLAGFLIISVYEIAVSTKLSKSEKILWPILIFVFSTLGQIVYLAIRKKRI